MSIRDPFLLQVKNMLDSGKRIDADVCRELFHTPDLTGLGMLADEVNQKRNGRRVFFNINRHLNPTNLCINRCQFCAFYRTTSDQEGAYELSIDEMVAGLKDDVVAGCTEVHIVGGLHPDWPFDHYVTIVRSIHDAYPGLHIKGFTCVEIDHFSRISGRPVPEVLQELKKAGLGSMPGGGAEIFAERVRKRLCARKISGERWLEIAEIAHRTGIRSNATMLYGHIETVDERVDHLARLRELQDKTGGFQAFIPLSWHKEGTELECRLDIAGATGVDDLRMIAVARLFLDNFDHIKAYWVMLGKKLAQTALHFGADDLDGTVVDERITFMAGGQSDRQASIGEIVHLIEDAGRQPVERDTLYRAIREYAT